MKQPEPFGKFLLYGQVAVGGMAEIYKAKYADPAQPQIDLALKRILPSYTEDEGFVTMFKDEGNIAIRLKHPNIVNIYEVGEVNNDWYIAMEYIYGADLRVLGDACEKYNKRFTPTQIARIVCETAKALYYAHTCTDANGAPLNIVHRDCTPHNIMISHDNTIRLMDFGIAKAASRATKTRVGTVKGKSSYMSPEQARGKQLDGRSDMFTLGTVAWEMLTGHRLFKASSDFEILTKVLKSTIVRPSDIDSNVPVTLSDIIMKTLERDRDLRYPDCNALADALESWIAVNGDGSDARLGEYCMALTNKKGHSIAELPDYVPGMSLYKCDEEGNFVPSSNAPRHTMAMPPVDNGAPAVSGGMNMPGPQQIAPEQIPGQVPPAMQLSQPGFPAPSMVMQPTTNRVPAWYIGAYIVLIIGIAVSIVAGIMQSNKEIPELPSFEPPESLVSYKSHPDSAAVYVNGTKLTGEDGDFAQTPIFSDKRRVGDKITVKFEKDGHETVTVERNILFPQQSIEVKLMTEEEARLAKMTAIPKLVINTDPEGALVTVNGEEKGKSPVTLEDVDFGKKLNIEAALEQYKAGSLIYIASRDSDKELKLELEKEEAAPAPAPRPRARRPARSRSESGEGKLNIKSTPWAVVTIDGQRVGNTPITKEVKSGNRTVTLYQPSKKLKVSKTVKVKPKQTSTVYYNFNAKKWM